MKVVDFLVTEPDGQRVLFTVGLVRGQLKVVSGNAGAAKQLGVPNQPINVCGSMVGPDQPRRYLAGLRFAFSGSYLRATAPVER